MGSEVARRNYNESSDSIRYTARKYPSDLPSNRIKMSGFISGNLKADTKLFPDLHKKFLLTSQSTSSKNFCSPASFCLHFSFASYRINLLLTPVLSACFPVVLSKRCQRNFAIVFPMFEDNYAFKLTLCYLNRL